MSESSYLRFTVRGRRRIIRVTDVREIAPAMELDELDDLDEARRSFRGMMNLRGDVVPVFDLASSDAAMHPSRLVLVVERGHELVGLVVDEVHDVVTFDDALVAARSVGPGLVVEAVRHEGELLTVFDPNRAELGGHGVDA